MIAFIAPNPAHHIDPENSGTYNGYVAIPPEHCARYVYDMDPFIPRVHGGITYHKESEIVPNSLIVVPLLKIRVG